MLRHHSPCAVAVDAPGSLRTLPAHRCQPRKRLRPPTTTQPFPVEALPDDCLLEVLRRLSSDRDRAHASLVSKRWLSLLACTAPTGRPSPPVPFLARFLDEGEASDLRLAAAAVSANALGGLRELCVGGSVRVTDAGLGAVARGSRRIRALTLADCPLLTEAGLLEVTRCCASLEDLRLFRCTGLAGAAIASSCRKLICLVVESCPGIGDEFLRPVGSLCRLRSVSISDCPLVGDRELAGLVSSAGNTLETLRLRRLAISDASLASVGLYGTSLTALTLSELGDVNERGFWAMAAAGGLRRLRSAEIAACRGVTDLGLAAVALAATSLETLRVTRCGRLTFLGLRLLRASGALNRLEIVGCEGIADRDVLAIPNIAASPSLLSISVRDCRYLGDRCLRSILDGCPKLRSVELSGAPAVTRSGLLCLADTIGLGLTRIELGGCGAAVDDAVAGAIARDHGGTLRRLVLKECGKVTDAGLLEILLACGLLRELDVSGSQLTDLGLMALGASALRVLSLAGCSRITESGLEFLCGSGLCGLDLRHCAQIPTSALMSLRQRMDGCEIIY